MKKKLPLANSKKFNADKTALAEVRTIRNLSNPNLWAQIFSYLDVKDANQFASTNKAKKHLNQQAIDQSLTNRLRIEFPHQYAIATKQKAAAAVQKDNKSQYQSAAFFSPFYKEAYENEYKNLPPRLKKLFLFIKNGSLESIITSDYTLDEFVSTVDGNAKTPANWAIDNKKQGQLILNHIYQLALKQNADKDSKNHVVNTQIKDQYGYTILHFAVICLQPIATLKSLLEKNAEINATDNRGKTVLHFSIQFKSPLTSAFLLQQPTIDPSVADNEGLTPLHLTVLHNETDTAKLLLKSSSSETLTEDNKNSALVTDIKNSARNNRPIPINAKTKAGNTAAFIAVMEGNLDILQSLFDAKANLNIQGADGLSPLIAAVDQGKLPVIDFLLAAGVNVNLQTLTGDTALYYAAEQGNHVIVERLLKQKNIAVNLATNNLNTPLHIACYRQHEKVVDLLLTNPNEKPALELRDSNDLTPLFVALHLGNENIARQLIEAGADTKAICLGVSAMEITNSPALKQLLGTLSGAIVLRP